jgi:hypothetical protein
MHGGAMGITALYPSCELPSPKSPVAGSPEGDRADLTITSSRWAIPVQFRWARIIFQTANPFADLAPLDV